MNAGPFWIRGTLRLLPRRFRDRFGDSLAETVDALSADAKRAGGLRQQFGYTIRELAAVAQLALTLRWHPLASRPHGTPRTREAMKTLLDDVRWAVRYARRRPVFAFAVTITLAVAIAAATVAFGLCRAVLWRPVPFDDASRLVFVWEELERGGQPHAGRVTGSRYAAWRDTQSGLVSISLFGAAGFTMDGPAGAVSVRGVRVSAGYFETLGIRPALGRTFLAAEELPGHHRVVILSYAFWQQRLGARREAIGETLRLSGEPYTIVGVMPPVTFPGWPVNPATVTLEPDARELWTPIPGTPALDADSRAHVFGVIARLGPGVTEANVVDRLNRTSVDGAPDAHRARLAPLRQQFVTEARTPLLALAGATLALLLIACANLATLYASAFEARRSEFAVRAAIGAGASRLVRQVAIEATLLAAVGAAGGLLLAGAALPAIPRFVPPSIPFLTAPAVDAHVVAFAVVVALISVTMLAGWPMARLMLATPLPRGTAAGPRSAVHRELVVSQLAITVALAAAAGLLGQSLWAVRVQPTGFAIDGVLVADIGLPAAPSDALRITTAEQRLLDAIAARPNVLAVAAAYDHPLEANWSEAPAVSGDVTAEDQRRPAELRIVSPGYFHALEVELLDGRTLTAREGDGAAVVNEAFAREIGGRAIGRRIRTGTPRLTFAGAPNEFEIVGVVANERFRGLEQPAQPAFYLSTRQFPQATFALLVRTPGDPLGIASDVRAAVRATDAAITFDRPTSLDRILSEQLVPRRVTTDLIGGFATLALGLAALGLYGLLAATVGTRRREIAIRIAVGARPAAIARQLVGDCLRHVGVGIALGCGFALLSGRLLEGLLVGVSPQDPATLTAVAALLLTVALLAALVPARRAACVDPAEALRAE
jgi:predicted permease